MSRKRFIHPELWQDPAVAKMTRDERLLFVGIITIADDEGRLVASPAKLQGAIYPSDNGDVTPKRVKAWRDALLAKNPNVQLYERDGIEYISLRRWERYQKPSNATPSKLPKPPRTSREDIASE